MTKENGSGTPENALAAALLQNKKEIIEQKSMIDLDAVRRHRDVTPPELVPVQGGAAQVAYYQSVRFTKISDHDDLVELDGPVSLFNAERAAFKATAVGVRITTRQTWRSAGLSLGHLLHSVSLAPGEVTKIAVVDWQRREAGQKIDATDAKEALFANNTQDTVHKDVTSMVADEMQSGSSSVKSEGWSEQHGRSGGGLFSGLFGGGSSGGAAHNSSIATTVGFSIGSKNVAADEVNRVHNVTHQAANAIRSRRAATVQESSQSEHETATTRVVANYNHMHSLNMMYYEVIQNYSVETEVVDAERILFIPFESVDFNTGIISEFNSVLRQAAKLRGDDYWVEVLKMIAANDWEQSAALITHLDQNRSYYSSAIWLSSDPLTLGRALSGFKIEGGPVLGAIDLNPVAISGNYLGFLWPFQPDDDEHETERIYLFGNTTRQRSVRQKLKSVSIHAANFVDPGIEVDGAMLKIVTIDGEEAVLQFDGKGHAFSMQWDKEIDIEEIQDAWFFLYDSKSAGKPVSSTKGTAHLTIRVEDDFGVSDLRCVADVYKPATRAGTYLGWGKILHTASVPAQTFPDEKTEWERSYLDHHYTHSEIPVGTGGVFAEAVLGRANAAEKLDLSRFWNWQDSPIPILPPGIEPVQVSSRYQSPNLDTHGLEAGSVTLQQIAAIPVLQGLQAASEVMSANIFRDMSNAKAAADAASVALSKASESGEAASKDALEQQKAAMGHLSSLIGKGMELAKSAEGAGGATGKGPGKKDSGAESTSEKGAAVNLEEVEGAAEGGEGEALGDFLELGEAAAESGMV